MPELKWRIPIEVPTGQVKTAATEVGKLGKGLTDGEKAVKALQKELKLLQVPNEIKRLRAEIEGIKSAHEAGHGGAGGGLFGKIAKQLGLEAVGFHSVGLAAHEAHAKVGEFLEFIGAEAALDVLKEIGEKIFEIGEEAVRAAAKAERINRVINIAAGGKEMGEATRKWIEQFSKTSEFTEEMNERAYIGLKKVGVGQQQAGLFMKAAADVAAVSADKDEAYQAAIQAFTAVQSRGKVSARQLRPLGIGVNDIRSLGGQYAHMNVQQLSKTLESGTFGQNDILRLIMSRAHETKLGARSADNIDLLSTKMSKLSELPERFFKKLADTKSVGQLAHALDGVLTKLDPESPTGQKIFGALDHAFSTIADTVGSIDFDAVGAALKDDVIPAIESLIGLVKPMVEDFEQFFRGAHRLHDILVGPTPQEGHKLKEFHSNYRSAAEEEESPSFLIPRQPTTVTKSGAKVHAWHGAMHAVGEEAGKGIESGMRDSLDMHSPSRVMERIGTDAAAGLRDGVEGESKSVRVAAPAQGGARNIHLEISPVIQVSGGKDGAEQGKRAADAFTRSIDRQTLISLLEQALNAQGGTNA